MTPSDILTEALIFYGDPRNWCQGKYHAWGQSCLAGVLHHCAYGGDLLAVANPDTELAKEWAYRYLEEAIDPGNPEVVCVEDWNDAPERCIWDIRDALNRAISLAVEKGE